LTSTRRWSPPTPKGDGGGQLQGRASASILFCYLDESNESLAGRPSPWQRLRQTPRPTTSAVWQQAMAHYRARLGHEILSAPTLAAPTHDFVNELRKYEIRFSISFDSPAVSLRHPGHGPRASWVPAIPQAGEVREVPLISS